MPGWSWAVVAGLAFGFSQIANRGVNRRLDALSASAAMVTSLLGYLVVATVVTGQAAALADLTPGAVAWFAAAGVVHFLAGWTLFALSQQRIGPSRTASVVSVNPVMAAVIAWLVLSEDLRPVTWLGVLAVTAGVALVASSPRSVSGFTAGFPGRALAATTCFSISPLMVRFGLERFDHPLVGLTVGMAVTAPLMLVLAWFGSGRRISATGDVRRWLAIGGATAALAIAAQWTAFDRVPVGVAIGIQQLNTPVVLFVGPLALRSPAERITSRLALGTVLILAGAVTVALFGRAG